MKGLLLDLPQVIPGAERYLETQGLTDRCEVVAQDFLHSVRAGADAYVLKWIVHDWNDDDSTTILKNCHRAMRKDSKLLVVEAIIPPGNQPSFHKFMDLNMMVMLGGRERTEPEYRSLLEAAGFELTAVTPTRTEMMVIEGMPK
jgi:hypothetical protein